MNKTGMSVNVTRVVLTATAIQILGPNPRRRAIILSAGANPYSISLASNLVVKQATWNFLANQVFVEHICYCELGSVLTLPFYGISDSGGATIEITEVMTDEATGSDH